MPEMVEENDMFGRTNRADGPLDIAILGIGVLIVEPSRLVRRLVSCKNNPTSHLSCPPFDMFGRAKNTQYNGAKTSGIT